MPCYVGLDASKRLTSVCVLRSNGETVREGDIPTSPKAIVGFLRGDRLRFARVGIEAGSVGSWLGPALIRAGLPVTQIETRRAHSILKERANKTDRSDARGIADLMRTATFTPVHMKSSESQHVRALVTARKLVKAKVLDLQNGIRGLLHGFGLPFDAGRARSFEARARDAARRLAIAQDVVLPLLTALAQLRSILTSYDKTIRVVATASPVCSLLMTAPGVGPITALLFYSSIDDPSRFRRSRNVGPHFGLVPRTQQSGESERRGRISKRGDAEARASLYCAGLTALRTSTRPSWLKTWGLEVAARRGRKRAAVAVARRLAVVLHKMWITGTPFRWEQGGAPA